jgi:molecular chaperone GrpE
MTQPACEPRPETAESKQLMATNDNGNAGNRIPINFMDSDKETDPAESSEATLYDEDQELLEITDEDLGLVTNADGAFDLDTSAIEATLSPDPAAGDVAAQVGGPDFAELVATRAELKRIEGEVRDLRDSLARRQADFENYRKRTDRERGATHDRVVADIAAKLLPVLDNLKRALETEASVEASESDEFRHFLSGVDLIYKQLGGVLDALGVKPVLAEGEHFNPHLHEAVVTESTDDYEPDTVIQEIVRGFTLGDTLIRPALVKVAVKK